jgi:hypothetical protein
MDWHPIKFSRDEVVESGLQNLELLNARNSRNFDKNSSWKTRKMLFQRSEREHFSTPPLVEPLPPPQ